MKLQAKINLFKNQTGNVKAFASVTLGGEYVINDLRVMDGAKGLWVANPSKSGFYSCFNHFLLLFFFALLLFFTQTAFLFYNFYPAFFISSE